MNVVTLMKTNLFYSHTRTPKPGISQLYSMRWKQNFNGYPPFLTTDIPIALMGILRDATGSGKSKMAA